MPSENAGYPSLSGTKVPIQVLSEEISCVFEQRIPAKPIGRPALLPGRREEEFAGTGERQHALVGSDVDRLAATEGDG